MIVRALAVVVLLAIYGSSALAFDERDRFNRRTFLTTTEVGSLGFIRYADSEADGQGAWNVNRIADGACEALPPLNRYWFRLNHFLPAREGQAGYFSVRIVVSGTKKRNGQLTLYRNENWYHLRDGKAVLLGVFDKTGGQIEMSLPDFFAFHHRDSIEADEVVLGSAVVGDFHASIEKRDELVGPSSWSDRYLIGEVEDGAAVINSRVLVQHIRFEWTANRESTKAPAFYIDRGDASEAHISVSAPGVIEGERAIEARVSFGGAC